MQLFVKILGLFDVLLKVMVGEPFLRLLLCFGVAGTAFCLLFELRKGIK